MESLHQPSRGFAPRRSDPGPRATSVDFASGRRSVVWSRPKAATRPPHRWRESRSLADQAVVSDPAVSSDHFPDCLDHCSPVPVVDVGVGRKREYGPL